jgi:hypothetical protein
VPHQSRERFRSGLRNLRAQIVVDNIEADLDAVDVLLAGFTSVRRFSGRYFPKDDSKTEDVRHLGVLLAFNDLWSHPLVGTNLSCHVISLESRPTKVRNLGSEAIVDQYIQANQKKATSLDLCEGQELENSEGSSFLWLFRGPIVSCLPS